MSDANAESETRTSGAEATEPTVLTRKQRRWRKNLPWSETITDAFPGYADVLDRAIREARRRYSRFSRWHMTWFRVGGFLEIALSVSFPFVIAVLGNSQSDEVIITGISVAIALVGGIRGFYGWNENWRLYRTQQLALTGIVQRWELELLALAPEPKTNLPKAHQATKRAIEEVSIALEHEQDTFFGSVRLPDELTQRNGSAKAEAAGTPAK